MRVYDLKPGNLIKGDGVHVKFATCLAVHRQHPRYPHLALVLWRVHTREDTEFFSHDALQINQEVGELEGDNDLESCWARLLNILPGPVVV
jgi:hypothetical protein